MGEAKIWWHPFPLGSISGTASFLKTWIWFQDLEISSDSKEFSNNFSYGPNGLQTRDSQFILEIDSGR